MGGMVLETNMTDILTHVEEQNKLEKSEVSVVPVLLVLMLILSPHLRVFLLSLLTQRTLVLTPPTIYTNLYYYLLVSQL